MADDAEAEAVEKLLREDPNRTFEEVVAILKSRGLDILPIEFALVEAKLRLEQLAKGNYSDSDVDKPEPWEGPVGDPASQGLGMEQFEEVLRTEGLKAGRMSVGFLTWLIDSGVPPDVVEDLGRCWFKGNDPRIGHTDFYPEEEIVADSKEFPQDLEGGFLVMGSCGNGDPIVLDVRERVGSVGYLCHDYVWVPEGESVDVRQHHVLVAYSLGAFVAAAPECRHPIDYFHARRE